MRDLAATLLARLDYLQLAARAYRHDPHSGTAIINLANAIDLACQAIEEAGETPRRYSEGVNVASPEMGGTP